MGLLMNNFDNWSKMKKYSESINKPKNLRQLLVGSGNKEKQNTDGPWG
jgi:hypothetical protein